ncbi:hypothetical protein [Actinocorallia libanotica]|uniref:Uncharacterized protein n=1 Tax=Actinocorallia libanotica TaxID=46162 RepID=A0ABN1Q1P7_9ACTN
MANPPGIGVGTGVYKGGSGSSGSLAPKPSNSTVKTPGRGTASTAAAALQGRPTPKAGTIKAPATPAKTPAQVAAENAAAAAEAQLAAQKASARADALASLTMMFEEWGLGGLAGVVTGYLQQDYTVNQILVEIRKSEPYKKRFAGNDARVKAGYAALSPAEYLATENAYKRLLQESGLPKGFYDDPSDFAGWIGNNVSVAEIGERVQLGVDAVNNSDPNYLSALRRVGFGEGDLLAAMLDQNRAMPILRRQVGMGKLGSAAMKYGLNWEPGRVEEFYDTLKDGQGGIDIGQAQQAYGQVAAALPGAQKLSRVYRGDQGVDQNVLEDEYLGQSALASQRRAALARREASTFSGSGAARKGSLTGKTAGMY